MFSFKKVILSFKGDMNSFNFLYLVRIQVFFVTEQNRTTAVRLHSQKMSSEVIHTTHTHSTYTHTITIHIRLLQHKYIKLTVCPSVSLSTAVHTPSSPSKLKYPKESIRGFTVSA